MTYEEIVDSSLIARQEGLIGAVMSRLITLHDLDMTFITDYTYINSRKRHYRRTSDDDKS